MQRKHLTHCLGALLLTTLLSTPLLAQPSSVGALPSLGPEARLGSLLKSLGSGDSIPHARVLFYEVEEDLCVFVGARKEPNAFTAQALVLRLENENDRSILKFPFKGKADHKDDDFFIWERCLPTPEHDENSKLRVEIRPRKSREKHNASARQNLYHLVNYPPADTKWGVDIYRTATGSYAWGSYVER